jgi:hypothetical protein
MRTAFPLIVSLILFGVIGGITESMGYIGRGKYRRLEWFLGGFCLASFFYFIYIVLFF